MVGNFKPKGWDELFENEKNRWNQPNEYVSILINGLKEKFQKNIHFLDVGYGTGRHLLQLHKNGFIVSGFDIASNAEKYARKRLSNIPTSERIKLKTMDMHNLPWPYRSSSFEGILAINVIHHTNYEGFLKIVDEIFRILVPGGLFLATVASKQNHKFEQGKKLDTYTYLTDLGVEKGIPHVFFDEHDLHRIFKEKYNIKKFRLISGDLPIEDKSMKKEGILDHLLIYVEKK